MLKEFLATVIVVSSLSSAWAQATSSPSSTPAENAAAATSGPAMALRLDESGLLDVKTNRYAVRANNVLDAVTGLAKTLAMKETVTSTTINKLPLDKKIEFSDAEGKLFLLNVNMEGPQYVSFPIEVISSRISDRVGVRVGDYLNKIKGYDWKRHCRATEGMWECVSSYSKKVTYQLGKDGVIADGSLQRALAAYPISRISLSAN